MAKKLLNYQNYLAYFVEYLNEMMLETAAIDGGMMDIDETNEEIESIRKLKLRTICLQKRLEFLESKGDLTNKVIIKSMLKYFTAGEMFILNESRVFPKKLLVKLHQLFNKQVDRTLSKTKKVVEKTVTTPIASVKATVSKQEVSSEYEQLTLF